MAPDRTARLLTTIILVIGIVMMVAGAATYYVVHDQLKAESITVPDDAAFLAGNQVSGPFSAFAQAQVINEHALEATGGLTYAELDREDPARQTAMSASFLRASLFTSVVAFGVATMAFGLGLTLVLVAVVLRRVIGSTQASGASATRTDAPPAVT